MWLQDELHRAPVNDFPPAWSSCWGDDEYGLWADLTITSKDVTATQKMRWIEPSQDGGFLMGSTQEERNNIEDKGSKDWANKKESNPFKVYVKSGFWLANTPCTQSFWTAVVGSNPSHFQASKQSFNLPVENVSFQDDENKTASVVYFLELLNSHLYNIISNNFNYLHTIKATLPTEVEWEYVCRADTATAYWWGNEFDFKKANCNSRSTSVVTLYPPNPWGLYDMHGNVSEWTSSVWKTNLADQNAKEFLSRRVVRGSSWNDYPEDARAAYRDYWFSSDCDRYRGFRFLIRSASQDH